MPHSTRYWSTETSPDFLVKFEESIALNNLCYLDEEVADEYGSVEIIERTEAKRAAPKKPAKVKAR